MLSDITFFVSAFLTLFAIVNPVTGVITFIALTSQMTKDDRIYVAKRSVMIAGTIAAIFLITGEAILTIFNITTDSLRVAGGILLFLIATDMLFAKTTRESITAEEISDAERRENISIFPLAMPLLTGPGAITTVILKTAETSGRIELKLMVLSAIIITFLLTFVIFRFSDKFAQIAGRTGIMVITRLMGIFLGAIAVTFIVNGIKGLFSLQ